MGLCPALPHPPVLKLLRVASTLYIGHPPRAAGSSLPANQPKTELWVGALAYLAMPLLWVAQIGLHAAGFRADIFKVAAYAYVAIFGGSYFVLTKPGVRLRSYWRSQHHLIGSREHSRCPRHPPLPTFWAATLALKLAFGWYALIGPLAPSLFALWTEPFPRITGRSAAQCDAGFTEECAYMLVMRFCLIVGRASVPVLVYFFDTYIFYNVCSAVCSVSLGWYRNLGKVSDWLLVLRLMPETVAHFNEKLLCPMHDADGDAAAAAAEDSAEGAGARARQWVRFGRAWNEIVVTLRDGDLLSNAESQDLQLAGSATAPSSASTSCRCCRASSRRPPLSPTPRSGAAPARATAASRRRCSRRAT